ncbi:MAG: hypothetical protein AAF149_04220 [Bacteroidota bacterium]
MKKHFILTLVILLVGSQVFSQGYTFKVLANRGENKIKTGSETKPLKTGASLKSDDELIVSSNAYLGLVHSSGKTMELKEAGNHKVSELAQRVSQGGSSVASKYADFVLSKMSAEGKKNRLSATGAVHRGPEDPISVFLPSISEIYGDRALIQWDSSQVANAYKVTIRNMFDDTLMEIKTNENGIEVDMTDEKLAKENVLLIEVSDGNDPTRKTESKAIRRLSEDKTTQVKDQLDALMEGVEEVTALNKFILAGFFEENNLLADALTAYQEAINMAPEVDTFKEAYEEFLYRNAMLKSN